MYCMQPTDYVSVLQVYIVKKKYNKSSDVDVKFSRCEDKTLTNADVLRHLQEKLKHLSEEREKEVIQVVWELESLSPDVPRKCTILTHDVEVKDATPIKQHPQ